jgi:hypothetical protein
MSRPVPPAELVDWFLGTLVMDGPAERSASGAEWTLEGFRQRLRLAHDERFGPAVTRVHIETDLADFAHVPARRALLGELSRIHPPTALCAPVMGDDWRLRLHACVDVTGENALWTRPVSVLVLGLQVAEAVVDGAALVRGLGGRSVRRGEPRPRSIAEIVGRLAAQAGRRSAWTGSPELELLAGVLEGGNAFAMHDDDELTAELPFGPEGTSLLQIDTAASHPSLGIGLSLRLLLPDVAVEARVVAAELNAAERRGECPAQGLGAWRAMPPSAPGDEPWLAFVTFVPGSLYRPGILANLGVAMAGRARWASEVLTGSEGEVDVAAVVRARLDGLR